VREFYAPFESPVLAAASDLYRHEMPGGQYTNLFEQARALGLADRWPDVCRMYADVNQMLGDIVKVTPTSKSVGDLALFLIANDLTTRDIETGERELAFPQSVIDLLDGSMGQPLGGFPAKLRKRILGDRKPLRGRPGKTLPPADFAQTAEKLQGVLGRDPLRREVVSYLLYPQVYQEFAAHEQHYADTSVLPTPVFFYGMQPGEEIAVDIEPGKTLIVKLLVMGEPHDDGQRTVFFELNGQPRDVTVVDRSLGRETTAHRKADPADATHVAASMPGMVVSVAVSKGDKVAQGQKLLMLEAMKMQSTLVAEREGRVEQLLVSPGSQVETGDLLLTIVSK
jgi:pyruvate carboxylase